MLAKDASTFRRYYDEQDQNSDPCATTWNSIQIKNKSDQGRSKTTLDTTKNMADEVLLERALGHKRYQICTFEYYCTIMKQLLSSRDDFDRFQDL